MDQNRSVLHRAPEPRKRSGEILLSHNHIALLHGLYDRPRGTAQSTADWARAAVPYIRTFRSTASEWLLQSATFTMHPAWVKHRREARRHVWTLTRRGRAILECKVPAYIRGYGPYHGLSSFRRPAQAKSSGPIVLLDPQEWSRGGWASVDAWWQILQDHPVHRGVVHVVNTLVARWNTSFTRHAELYEGGFQLEMAEQLRRYICWFVMTHRVFPRGVHEVPIAPEVDSYGFEVDFDELGS
jgi:hypothetical protein